MRRDRDCGDRSDRARTVVPFVKRLALDPISVTADRPLSASVRSIRAILRPVGKNCCGGVSLSACRIERHQLDSVVRGIACARNRRCDCCFDSTFIIRLEDDAKAQVCFSGLVRLQWSPYRFSVGSRRSVAVVPERAQPGRGARIRESASSTAHKARPALRQM